MEHSSLTCLSSSSLQEAAELSSLRPQLDANNVSLYAVVHEDFGVKEFKNYFKGDVFLDLEVSSLIVNH